ncbi:hypothetical protein FAUST_6229 [Fusarium austroamericanum]|uniref:Enoyl reductase (ER) domain-containing protein n=1 Tax=Fusarium austroamericanum TaxID=282268 RepID=A0AAN5ZA48_FUSAU|nr:hypothetical protein FAUST_6229 [Fusarium austroamericanum]
MHHTSEGRQTVRAAVFRGLGVPLRVEDIILDPPSPTEILIRMKAVGLCHTEQHVLKGEMPVGKTPIVLGHEGAGIVEAIGSDVKDIVIGDHVALLWKPACRQCQHCQSGDHHRCDAADVSNDGLQLDGTYRRYDASGESVGSFCRTGAFAEKTVVDQASVVVVDRALPFEVVALASCCGAGGYGAVTNALHVEKGDTVLVVGAGGQGSIAVQAAQLNGARRVIVADRHEQRLLAAVAMGATDTVLTIAEGQLISKVLELTNGRGVDHAVVCAGSADALVQAYRATKSGGSVVLSGIPNLMATSIPLSPIEILGGNGKVLLGSQYGAVSQLLGVPQVLDQHRHGKLRIGDVIRREYILEEVAKGYQDLAAGEPGRGLIRFN